MPKRSRDDEMYPGPLVSLRSRRVLGSAGGFEFSAPEPTLLKQKIRN